MALRLRFITLLVVMPIVALAAWRQDPQVHARMAGAQAPNWAELMATMERMHSAMGAVSASGNSDADFVKLMLPHHQGAVDMAKTALLYGKDPQIRRLAQEIITDQESEIQLMQLWLRQRDAVYSKLDSAPDCE